MMRPFKASRGQSQLFFSRSTARGTVTAVPQDRAGDSLPVRPRRPPVRSLTVAAGHRVPPAGAARGHPRLPSPLITEFRSSTVHGLCRMIRPGWPRRARGTVRPRAYYDQSETDVPSSAWQ
eukprot:756648-Hanusia_phi.AAC.2